MPDGDELSPHELFGGAIALSFPARLADVSTVRDVPDHQEVFADGAADQSLIVEVVEHQPVPDSEAALFYINDLAQVGGAAAGTTGTATELRADDMPRIPTATYKAKISAVHVVAKGRQGVEAANSVQVLLTVVRLPQHGSDLLITLNTPTFISGISAAAEHAGAGQQDRHVEAPAMFADILRTLIIKDYGLFG